VFAYLTRYITKISEHSLYNLIIIQFNKMNAPAIGARGSAAFLKERKEKYAYRY